MTEAELKQSEETFTLGRKWSIPESLVVWEEHHINDARYEHDWSWGHIITPSGIFLRVKYSSFEMNAGVTRMTGPEDDARSLNRGLSGLSKKGDTFHVGTPGFALASGLIAAMEELERTGLATPLPTKAVNSAGITREEYEADKVRYAESRY